MRNYPPALAATRLLLVLLASTAPCQGSAATVSGTTNVPSGLSRQPLALDALGWAAQPSVAADPANARFILSWQARLDDGCSALRVTTLSLQGELGEVREVSRGCDWFVNWADHPKLAIADNGDWVTFWLQREGAATYAYGIRISRSTDEGRSWSAPVTPHDDGTLTEHGFVSLAAAGDERMLLVWLDGRHSLAANADAGAHDHGEEASMSLRSAVIDRQGALSEASEIDSRVCSCCWTDLLRRADGEHLALFRDRSDAEIRDTGLARRDRHGWTAGGTVFDDGWKIAACPVNGPGLAANSQQALAVWSTMPDAQTMAVRARLIDTPAAPLTVEQGSGVLGRVDVEAFGDGWLLSWLGAGEPGRSVLRLGHYDADLALRERIDVVSPAAGRGIGVPRLAAQGATALLVWTEVDESSVSSGTRTQTRLQALLLAAADRSL